MHRINKTTIWPEWMCMSILLKWRDLILLIWNIVVRIMKSAAIIFCYCCSSATFIPLQQRWKQKIMSGSRFQMMVIVLTFAIRNKVIFIGKCLSEKLQFCFDIIISAATSIPFAFAYFYYFLHFFYFVVFCNSSTTKRNESLVSI